jgi:hypothetical protein
MGQPHRPIKCCIILNIVFGYPNLQLACTLKFCVLFICNIKFKWVTGTRVLQMVPTSATVHPSCRKAVLPPSPPQHPRHITDSPVAVAASVVSTHTTHAGRTLTWQEADLHLHKDPVKGHSPFSHRCITPQGSPCMSPREWKCTPSIQTQVSVLSLTLHYYKARAHKGGVRIGKTPKKLASICCP